MASRKPGTSDPAGTRPMTEEADIGSGEKTPAQIETEKMIGQIPPLPPGGKDGKPGKDVKGTQDGSPAQDEGGLPG